MKYMMLALMLVGCETRRENIEWNFTRACRTRCEDYDGFELKAVRDALMCQCVTQRVD